MPESIPVLELVLETPALTPAIDSGGNFRHGQFTNPSLYLRAAVLSVPPFMTLGLTFQVRLISMAVVKIP